MLLPEQQHQDQKGAGPPSQATILYLVTLLVTLPSFIKDTGWPLSLGTEILHHWNLLSKRSICYEALR